MKQETQEMLSQFHSVPWFQQVGNPKEKSVISVESWAMAMRWCKDANWESVQLQVNNVTAINVNRLNYSRFQSWNSTVAEMHQRITPLIGHHVLPVAAKHKLPQRFQESVLSDLMEICIQVEFGDICPPIYFLDVVWPWYQKGHFPCGWDGPELSCSWEGPMPSGRLAVF